MYKVIKEIRALLGRPTLQEGPGKKGERMVKFRPSGFVPCSEEPWWVGGML
jgi:hypothetical protein